jgi:dynein heavy chain
VLLEGLGGEQSRWEAASATLDGQYNALVGDCLVGAATIAYLAPVGSELRESAVSRWRTSVRKKDLCTSPDYTFQRLLGDQITIRRWNMAGLPTDQTSIDNAVMATRARRWPLMIDPQGQAARWIKNIEGSPKSSKPNTGRLAVLKPSDSDLSRRLEQCIQLGLPILLEGVAQTLDPLLDPLLD